MYVQKKEEHHAGRHEGAAHGPDTVPDPQRALNKQLATTDFAGGANLLSPGRHQGEKTRDRGPKIDAKRPDIGERSGGKYMEPKDKRKGPELKPMTIEIADAVMDENKSAKVDARVHDPDNPGKTEHLWFEWSQLSGPKREQWSGTYSSETTMTAPEVRGKQYIVGELQVFKRGHWAVKGLMSSQKFIVEINDVGDPETHDPEVVKHCDHFQGPLVAANEEARVWGDPHFIGADGGKFDVQGKEGRTYNLLSDSGLTFYGTYHRWKREGLTVVGKTEITVLGEGGLSRVIVDAKSDLYQVDDQNLEDSKKIVMKDGGTTTRHGREIITVTREGYVITQHDKGAYINAEVKSGTSGVHNGVMPTGLMGQTFDADHDPKNGKSGVGAQGEGAIKGVYTDYEVQMGKRPPLGPGCVIPAVIAAGEKAKVHGDPHFVGGDGGKYDVQGKSGRTYNLLTDTNLAWHGTFIGTKPGITWVGRTMMELVGENAASLILFDAKKNIYMVDGVNITAGKAMVLADGGVAEMRGTTLTVTTAEGYKIVQHDKGGHIDAEIHTGTRGVGNGKMPTGLMGQTFDADKIARHGKKGKGAQGEGAIDGVVTDYEVRGFDDRFE